MVQCSSDPHNPVTLMKVNKQIDQFGGDTASVVLVITDGRLGDGPAAYRQVTIIHAIVWNNIVVLH